MRAAKQLFRQAPLLAVALRAVRAKLAGVTVACQGYAEPAHKARQAPLPALALGGLLEPTVPVATGTLRSAGSADFHSAKAGCVRRG